MNDNGSGDSPATLHLRGRGSSCGMPETAAGLASHVPISVIASFLKPHELLAVALASRGLRLLYERVYASSVTHALTTILSRPASAVRDQWVRTVSVFDRYLHIQHDPYDRFCAVRSVVLRSRTLTLPAALQHLDVNVGDYWPWSLPADLRSLAAPDVLHAAWLPAPSTLRTLRMSGEIHRQVCLPADSAAAGLQNLTSLSVVGGGGGGGGGGGLAAGQPLFCSQLLRGCSALTELALACATDTVFRPGDLPPGLLRLRLEDYAPPLEEPGCLPASVVELTLHNDHHQPWAGAVHAGCLPLGLQVLDIKHRTVVGLFEAASPLRPVLPLRPTGPFTAARLRVLRLSSVYLASPSPGYPVYTMAFGDFPNLESVALNNMDRIGFGSPQFFAGVRSLACSGYLYNLSHATVSTSLVRLNLHTIAGFSTSFADCPTFVVSLPPNLVRLALRGDFVFEPLFSAASPDVWSSLTRLDLPPVRPGGAFSWEVVARHFPNLTKLRFVAYDGWTADEDSARRARWAWELPGLTSLGFGAIDMTRELGPARRARDLRKLDLGFRTRFNSLAELPPALSKLTVREDHVRVCAQEEPLEEGAPKNRPTFQIKKRGKRAGTVSLWLM